MRASRFGANRRFLAPRDSRDSRFEQPCSGVVSDDPLFSPAGGGQLVDRDVAEHVRWRQTCRRSERTNLKAEHGGRHGPCIPCRRGRSAVGRGPDRGAADAGGRGRIRDELVDLSSGRAHAVPTRGPPSPSRDHARASESGDNPLEWNSHLEWNTGICSNSTIAHARSHLLILW